MSISGFSCCQKCGVQMPPAKGECVQCGYTNTIMNPIKFDLESQKIKLKEELLKLVREDKKNATTRLGIKDYRLGDATLINANGNHNDFVEIKIVKLELIKYKDISDDLAKIENYNSANELRKVLLNIYKEIKDDDYLTIVYFKKK